MGKSFTTQNNTGSCIPLHTQRKKMLTSAGTITYKLQYIATVLCILY